MTLGKPLNVPVPLQCDTNNITKMSFSRDGSTITFRNGEVLHETFWDHVNIIFYK
jgi:hypothetical protein